ncbi:MAG: sulfatase-like hydrolase/transferase [Planctomycetaceae bacterium]|nr:sulfatase-like hydrolase/transferase [Planctomycetaceae bacterium]
MNLLRTLLFCLLTYGFLQEAPEISAAQKPNIILFIADDMAWDDCTAYGHPHIQTPYLQQLADQGMIFHNAYLTCSSCSPSRSSILTGRYPHSTGGAFQLHNNLPSDQVGFVSLLREAGYYTALAGKIHPRNSFAERFDTILGTGAGNSGG